MVEQLKLVTNKTQETGEETPVPTNQTMVCDGDSCACSIC